MPSEPDWLGCDEIIALHDAVVVTTGEPAALRDIGLLESAIARPRQLWAYADTCDLVDLACLLMLAIARNHPFVQGNKRTGFVAGYAFLDRNGHDFAIPDTIQSADILVRAITDPTSEAEFVSLVRRHAVSRL